MTDPIAMRVCNCASCTSFPAGGGLLGATARGLCCKHAVEPGSCRRCGHSEHAHYNARGTGVKRCHHRGKHDMRCVCRGFTPAVLDEGVS